MVRGHQGDLARLHAGLQQAASILGPTPPTGRKQSFGQEHLTIPFAELVSKVRQSGLDRTASWVGKFVLGAAEI